MFEKRSRLTILMIFGFLSYFAFIVGCKNTGDPLGHQGPFDVPTSTSTPISGQVNLTCYVNYGGFQSNVAWNLVDPNGNTINSTAQMSGSTAFSFTPTTYGNFSVNIPAQSSYLYSVQALTITNVGNYSVTFSCSGQTLSTNSASITYSTSFAYQTAVTVSYSSLGNLNVPVSILTSGISSAFNISPSVLTLNNSGASSPVTIFKNTCANTNTSLNFSANDFTGTSTGATSAISIIKGYSIPVTLSITGAYGGSSDGFILSVADAYPGCSFSYPVSIDSYYGGNPVHVNSTGTITTGTALSIPLSTSGANTTFYLTTPDGVQHSSALYSTNYGEFTIGAYYWDVTFFNSTAVITNNNLVGNGVLIATTY